MKFKESDPFYNYMKLLKAIASGPTANDAAKRGLIVLFGILLLSFVLGMLTGILTGGYL